jgi:hypothetical protein
MRLLQAPRAWDDVANKILYARNIEQFDDMLGFRFPHFETDKPVYMWPTGLTDRNRKGRLMYEGDVYKQDGRHYVIEWSEYNLGFVARSLTSDKVLPGYLQGELAVYDDYEYIGSIYEHPHLIES